MAGNTTVVRTVHSTLSAPTSTTPRTLATD